MDKQVFISYAHEDAQIANSICEFLEQRDVSCWIAPRDISPGASYAEEIIKAIERTQALVLVLSEHANNSPHVGLEVERAVSKARTVFPVRIREVQPSKRLEYFVSGSQWIDAWASPIEHKMDQLAGAIHALSGKRASGRPATTGQPPAANRSPQQPAAPVTPAAPAARSAHMSLLQAGAVAGTLLLGIVVLFIFFAPPAKKTPERSVASGLNTATPSPASPAVDGGTALSVAIARSLDRNDPAPLPDPAQTLARDTLTGTNARPGAVEPVPQPPFYSGPPPAPQNAALPYGTAAPMPVVSPNTPPPAPGTTSVAATTADTGPGPVTEATTTRTAAIAPVPVAPKPAPKRKTPPAPKKPAITNVTQAKLAYRRGDLTKQAYRDIVERIESTYESKVRKLKEQYRQGKFDKAEYKRRVRELKLRYYG